MRWVILTIRMFPSLAGLLCLLSSGVIAQDTDPVYYRAKATVHLKQAIALGNTALKKLRGADPNQHAADLRPVLEPLLTEAKLADQSLRFMKAQTKFHDPLLDWGLQKTDTAVSQIRSGLDQAGLPWEHYFPLTERNLTEAIRYMQQVLDIL